jgi:hypothetical protein
MSEANARRFHYLTIRLFVFLLKMQGQYSVRSALAEATSEMAAVPKK